MSDQIKRYIHEEGQFKIAVIQTTSLGRDVFHKLNLSPIGLQLITQAMTGALLLTADLKDESTLMFKFEGNGPAGSITVEANTQGHARGTMGDSLVNFQRDEGKGLFQTAIGDGRLSVRRRTEKNGKIFSSVVSLIDGEIALNYANYLLQSEQVPSAIQVGAVLDAEQGVKGSGGVLIQAMPGANENLLFILEQRLTEMDALGKIFSEENGYRKIIDWLTDDMSIKELTTTPVGYRCSCNRQRMLQMIATLPIKDLEDLAADGKTLELNCSFCNTTYPVSHEDVEAIIDMKKNPA